MKNKIPIARCPNCGRTVLYSDDPRDKLTVTVRAADERGHFYDLFRAVKFGSTLYFRALGFISLYQSIGAQKIDVL